MNIRIKACLMMLLLTMPLIVMAQPVIGVLTASWPECRDIAADVMREAGFRRSMINGFTDAEGVLLVTFDSRYWKEESFSSVSAIEIYLKAQNAHLLLSAIYGLEDDDIMHVYNCYHLCLYSKNSEGKLKLEYHQKL